MRPLERLLLSQDFHNLYEKNPQAAQQSLNYFPQEYLIALTEKTESASPSAIPN